MFSSLDWSVCFYCGQLVAWSAVADEGGALCSSKGLEAIDLAVIHLSSTVRDVIPEPRTP